jgi:2'-5' RNA ligase
VALNGIFIIAEIGGSVGERIRAIQQAHDPKLATMNPPHITIAGSSGVGPMRPTPVATIRDALDPIAATTAPIASRFEPPIRFMQSNIVVLPLDPHGPLRTLHERIATSGLEFAPARFTFTPHCTLSFYPTHPPDVFRSLLAVRMPEPFVIDHLIVYHTLDPQPPRRLLDLRLTG